VLTNLDLVPDAQFSVDAWVPPASYPVTLQNAPTDVSSIGVWTVFYERGWPIWQGGATATSPAATTATVRPPAYPFDAVDLSASLRFPPEGAWQSLTVRTTRESASGARPVDLSPLQARVHHPVITPDGRGLYSARWEADDSLKAADGAVLLLERSRASDGAGGSLVEHEFFKLIGPPGASALVPPPLPAELVPTPWGVVDFTLGELDVIDSTELGSYRAYRHALGRSFGRRWHNYGDSPHPTSPDSVTLRASVQSY
jgi:hypothetical protein